MEDLKSLGKSLESWYSDMPIGSLYESKAYFATTLSLSLQMSKPDGRIIDIGLKLVVDS